MIPHIITTCYENHIDNIIHCYKMMNSKSWFALKKTAVKSGSPGWTHMELTSFTCHQVLIYEDHRGVNEIHQLLIHQRNEPWSLTQREQLPSGLVQFISLSSILLQCVSTLSESKISNSFQFNVSESRDRGSEPSHWINLSDLSNGLSIPENGTYLCCHST